MCSCVGGAQLSQELQSKLALSSRQARSDQRSFEVASSATFAPIFAALASASATMCLAFAFPHSSQRFARRARALQLEARFCEVAPADQKTAKISLLAGQDVAPPSPRLRSPYPRQCALAASGLSLSLSLLSRGALAARCGKQARIPQEVYHCVVLLWFFSSVVVVCNCMWGDDIAWRRAWVEKARRGSPRETRNRR